MRKSWIGIGIGIGIGIDLISTKVARVLMTAHSQTARTDIKRTYQGKWGLTEGLGMKVNNHERGEGEYENQRK